LRWLSRDQPEVLEAREATSRIIKVIIRKSDIISRIGSRFKKETPQQELLDVNEVFQEMIVLLRNEASGNSISIHRELGNDLPKIMADRVQLQQVLLWAISDSGPGTCFPFVLPAKVGAGASSAAAPVAS